MKEYKVGEIFQFGKKKLKCVEKMEDDPCSGCIFLDSPIGMCKGLPQFIGGCQYLDRSDGKRVIFIELNEKENGNDSNIN